MSGSGPAELGSRGPIAIETGDNEEDEGDWRRTGGEQEGIEVDEVELEWQPERTGEACRESRETQSVGHK